MQEFVRIHRREAPTRPAKERLKDFREIYKDFTIGALSRQSSRCEQCGTPWCEWGCPLSNHISDWLKLAAGGEYMAAAELAETTNTFPEICGRICPQDRLCERECIINEFGSITIGAVERALTEYAFAHGGLEQPSLPPPNGRRVAIVGSGPAGLACADGLIRLGYAVTVFERAPIAGGLLTFGIPNFKLEKDVVARRIAMLDKLGIEFRVGVDVGRDLSFDDLRRDYDAIFLGNGAYTPRQLECSGSSLERLHIGLDFLVNVNRWQLGVDAELHPMCDVADKRVVVLGGGDTAMDCVRTCVRLGAETVTCMYRRDEANMPGSRREIKCAREEGVEFLFYAQPLELYGNGSVSEIDYQRMELGEADAEGRRRPVPIAGSKARLAADVVLIAFGFEASTPQFALDLGIELQSNGAIKTDGFGMTSAPGLFAGGDSVRGADLVVTAILDGREAARGIHRYLSGEDVAADEGNQYDLHVLR